MYIIQEKGKICFLDKELQRLEETLKFISEYDKTKIEEVSDDLIVNGCDGCLYISGYEPAPTEEEQRQKREQAYTQEVDPITCHISRLSDEEQTPEIEQEIAELKQERSDKVEDIKRRYPYPVGEEQTEPVESDQA